MIRTILIAAAVLLCLGGVVFALSRPDIGAPGPPVFLKADDRDGADTLPAATLSPRDADEVDGARRGGGNDGARADGAARQDQFEVAAPKAVKAHGDDWDDDRDDDDDNDDDDDDDD